VFRIVELYQKLIALSPSHSGQAGHEPSRRGNEDDG
jgi:hypothetical protein